MQQVRYYIMIISKQITLYTAVVRLIATRLCGRNDVGALINHFNPPPGRLTGFLIIKTNKNMATTSSRPQPGI